MEVTKVSIVIPAKNEAAGLEKLLPSLEERYPGYQLILVDDGSEDGTAAMTEGRSNAITIHHPYSMGNGAAIKAGARASDSEYIVFMDADGQHKAEDVEKLIRELDAGYDMVVGARSRDSHASTARLLANTFYNVFASFIVGRKVCDLTSGLRAVRASCFKEILHLLPNGFSYPTTSTMAFFRSGYSVTYVPIKAEKRIGKSHIKLFRDGVRFLMILFKIGTLYSPLKIFLPVSGMIFTTGIGYYMYTYITAGRFTNMSALLFTTAMTIFLMGLVSEQITSLIYMQNKRD